MIKAPRGRRTTFLTAALVVIGLVAGLWMFRRELLAFYKLRSQFERLPHNEQGYAEYRHRTTGIVFVRVPGGTFLMGSGKEERQHDNPFPESYFVKEEPRHFVTVSPFLAKYELSQTQWVNAMGSNPSHLKGEDHPIESVTWDECLDFCRRKGLWLPTEAQWEYACRAGTSGAYGGSGLLEEMGWAGKTAPQDTMPVGRKKANGFGLHDMHGNVSEWVEDVMDEEFYLRPEALGLDPICTANPGKPSSEWGRVARGGGTHHALFCRSAVRVSYYRDERSADLGFRPVFNLQ